MATLRNLSLFVPTLALDTQNYSIHYPEPGYVITINGEVLESIGVVNNCYDVTVLDAQTGQSSTTVESLDAAIATVSVYREYHSVA